MHAAAQACRAQGRVVIVGDVGLDLQRADLYEQGARRPRCRRRTARVATTTSTSSRVTTIRSVTSAGPRTATWPNTSSCWAAARCALDGLPRERYDVDDAADAYAAVSRDGERPLLVVLGYPERDEASRRTTKLRRTAPIEGKIGVALVGAGSFAQATHLPNLAKLGDTFSLRAVVSRTGSTARAVAERVGAAYATTDLDEVLRRRGRRPRRSSRRGTICMRRTRSPRSVRASTCSSRSRSL